MKSLGQFLKIGPDSKISEAKKDLSLFFGWLGFKR